MGRVVTFAQLPHHATGEGVSTAQITQDDMHEMAAMHVRIASGRCWTAQAPRGSDCYLFALAGFGAITAGDKRQRLPTQAFATVEEGADCTIENAGDGVLELVQVVAPPQPSARALPGFTGTLSVLACDDVAPVAVPEEKKTRRYFVGYHGAPSERGHAMIVGYEKETRTVLHHHPNAESMFVILDGALQFTINGASVTVRPGQAVYFGINDTHGLHTAEGSGGASFLEFHIPGAFTTVKEAAA